MVELLVYNIPPVLPGLLLQNICNLRRLWLRQSSHMEPWHLNKTVKLNADKNYISLMLLVKGYYQLP